MQKAAQSTDELVVELYRAARELPAEQFQEHALMHVKPWLRFASGDWGVGFVHAAPLHQVAPESLVEWQMLMRHVKEALAVNQAIHLIAAEADREQFVAVAEQHGTLYHADDRFLALLQREWPQVDDQRLPAPLLEAMTRAKRSSYVGEAISCDGLLVAGWLLLRVRAKAPVDALTPRRSLIARYFAEGHNHKEIARRAQISPATVRNHLRAIYEILGVRTRTELTALVRGRSARRAMG